MNMSFLVILAAFCLALVPFLGFPPELDRALVASGAVLIMILEGVRVYRAVRRRLEREGELPRSKPKTPLRRRSASDAGRRLLRRLNGLNGKSSKEKDEGGDQFNVYQL